MAGKRGHQAGVSEHGRMQVVRKVTDVLNERRCTLLEGPQVLLQIRADRKITKLLLQTAERNRQAGELLTHVVVQVACNACPFGILGFNQAPGQMVNLSLAREQRLFRLLALGDIEAAADVTGVAAIRFILRNAGIQNPPVDAVSSSDAVLHQERPASFDRWDINTQNAIDVVRMDSLQPTVSEQLLQRHSRELNTVLFK